MLVLSGLISSFVSSLNNRSSLKINFCTACVLMVLGMPSHAQTVVVSHCDIKCEKMLMCAISGPADPQCHLI